MILGMFFILSASFADAGNINSEPRVIYERETVIDFDAIDIEGQLISPEGSLIMERRRATFNPLITLREDFDDLMTHSVDEVK
tara:strand:- start:257 stop:505 length:249 start_codon:yes stop_codon:yes gene_type:complete